ncbi:glucose inhibited division protein B (nucleomorph) [Chroomonas mesostigmatica CCMP1168]|uniref:Glucose inhibited division protein B n=1 Tax=Chroomonas mesostigmatica CCMP1168 TaxID=1195612 RepID=J7G3Q7_9CRYP|nr:glucose inhibited division protein B [Chroomonas mesostigmatica CCMP1168]
MVEGANLKKNKKKKSMITFYPKSYLRIKIFKKKISVFKKRNLAFNFFEKFSQNSFEKSNNFVDHLILRNKYSNLISNKTLLSVFRRHFVDSLTIELFFNSFHPKKKFLLCLDIGTGGGFPGLLLSFFFPTCFFLLIESIKKKIIFHQKISNFLLLSNCKPLCSRAEIIGKSQKHRGNYDLIIARGVSELHSLIWFSFPLLISGGRIVVLKQIFKISEEISGAKTYFQTNKGKVKAVFPISSSKKGRMVILLK